MCISTCRYDCNDTYYMWGLVHVIYYIPTDTDAYIRSYIVKTSICRMRKHSQSINCGGGDLSPALQWVLIHEYLYFIYKEGWDVVTPTHCTIVVSSTCEHLLQRGGHSHQQLRYCPVVKQYVQINKNLPYSFKELLCYIFYFQKTVFFASNVSTAVLMFTHPPSLRLKVVRSVPLTWLDGKSDSAPPDWRRVSTP